MIAALIPFFLVARLPIEDGAWRYGPEYIFTVQMNMTRIPESTGISAVSRITSRLHCVPKKQDTLSCHLQHGQGFDINSGKEEDNIAKRRKNVTDDPIELLFNEEGIEKLIVNEKIRTYDLNILKTVVEQLHSGSDFNDIEDGTIESITRSAIGRCNVTIAISRDLTSMDNPTNDHNYKLEPLQQLHKAPGETIIIDKTPNLNNCTCYAEQYYRKYGDTVICEHGNITADLVSMTSRMQISDTDFISSTTRTGTVESDNEKYDVVEITTITLTDIQPATREPPAIVNPGQTKLLANYDITSISTDQ